MDAGSKVNGLLLCDEVGAICVAVCVKVANGVFVNDGKDVFVCVQAGTEVFVSVKMLVGDETGVLPAI